MDKSVTLENIRAVIKEEIKTEITASEERMKKHVSSEINALEERTKSHVSSEIKASEERMKDYIFEQFALYHEHEVLPKIKKLHDPN